MVQQQQLANELVTRQYHWRNQINQLLLGITKRQWPLVALFGYGYVLLPSELDIKQKSDEFAFELTVNVRNHSVIFTTESSEDKDETEARIIDRLTIEAMAPLG